MSDDHGVDGEDGPERGRPRSVNGLEEPAPPGSSGARAAPVGPLGSRGWRRSSDPACQVALPAACQHEGDGRRADEVPDPQRGSETAGPASGDRSGAPSDGRPPCAAGGGTGAPSCAARSGSASAWCSSSSSSSTWRCPLLASHRTEVSALSHIHVQYLVLGVLLEIGALAAYTQLTHAVLPPDGPKRFRLFRINMSTLALSHVSPGGTAPGAALGYRLLTQSGVSGADTGFALGTQGIGSAVVLNGAVLVRPGGLPAHPRVPRPDQPPRRHDDVGLGAGGRGRRHRGGPDGRLRWPVLPADPGPGAGRGPGPRGWPSGSASSTPTGSRRPGRADGRAVRRPDGRPPPPLPGRRLGDRQLAARRRLAVGVRGRLQPLHLAGGPAGRLRAGQHPGGHPHHPGRPGGGGVRPGLDDHRLRSHRRPGPVRPCWPTGRSTSGCPSPSGAWPTPPWSSSGAPSTAGSRCSSSTATNGAGRRPRTGSGVRIRPPRRPGPAPWRSTVAGGEMGTRGVPAGDGADSAADVPEPVSRADGTAGATSDPAREPPGPSPRPPRRSRRGRGRRPRPSRRLPGAGRVGATGPFPSTDAVASGPGAAAGPPGTGPPVARATASSRRWPWRLKQPGRWASRDQPPSGVWTQELASSRRAASSTSANRATGPPGPRRSAWSRCGGRGSAPSGPPSRC